MKRARGFKELMAGLWEWSGSRLFFLHEENRSVGIDNIRKKTKEPNFQALSYSIPPLATKAPDPTPNTQRHDPRALPCFPYPQTRPTITSSHHLQPPPPTATSIPHLHPPPPSPTISSHPSPSLPRPSSPNHASRYESAHNTNNNKPKNQGESDGAGVGDADGFGLGGCGAVGADG